MNSLEYNYCYLIVNIFGIYVVYKFMKVFFQERKSSNGIELLSYVAYYCLLVLAYFFTNVPLIFFLINIVCFFIITLNYKTSLVRRLTAVFSIYMVLVVIESLVAVAVYSTQFPLFSESIYSSVWGLTATKLISYGVALLSGNFRNINKEIKTPVAYNLLVLLLPGCSIYMLLVILTFPDTHQIYGVGFVGCLLLVNFITFYLYDSMLAAAQKEIERTALRQQNVYYEQHLENLKISVAETNALRHDFANHLQVMKEMIGQGGTKESAEYIQKIEADLKGKALFSNTENLSIDSIINYKLHLAEKKKIEVKAEVILPPKMDLDAHAMVCILGNLLDNAVEAATKAQSPQMSVEIKYNNQRLIIKVKNSYEGEIQWNGTMPQTSKKEKRLHGIGLRNVNVAVERLGGEMHLTNQDNWFFAVVIIPIEM